MRVGLVIPECSWHDVLASMVKAQGHEPIPCEGIPDAIKSGSGVVFAQWVGGAELPVLLAGLRCALEQTRVVPVVVLVRPGDLTSLHRARAAGAADVLIWPADEREIAAEIADATRKDGPAELEGRQRLRELAGESLVGENPKFKQCLEDLLLASRGDANVLLLGETGTGKEMFARAIHKLSRRSTSPFVVVDCPALKDTLWESELFGHAKGAFTGANADRRGRCQEAGAGVLLLDEIGFLSMAQQATLLRLIEQRIYQRVGENHDQKFHARIISATSVDLDGAVSKGKFRQDLLGRLDQLRIRLPGLRERRSDIAILARRFLDKYARGRIVTISPSALEILEDYDFPSNVRELENMITTALAKAGEAMLLLPKHLPTKTAAEEKPKPQHVICIPQGAGYVQAREFVEMAVDALYLSALLVQNKGNKSRTATEAGIDRGTLDQRLSRLDQGSKGGGDAFAG